MDHNRLIDDLLNQATAGAEELKGLAGYRLDRELGRGGMGVVYLLEHSLTGEQLALKLMLPRTALSAASRNLFEREIANTRALSHRNIVHVHASGDFREALFLALEFCNGGSVADLMALRGGSLPPAEALDIVIQSLDGLEYAHNVNVPGVRLRDGSVGVGRGLVHRDVKPNNILLQHAGVDVVAKLSDYGLAKAFDLAGLSGQTRTGSLGGTIPFMPRQQVIDFKYAKPEVDVWAMAASLYVMLTGFTPRDFGDADDPISVILNTDPVPIRKRNSMLHAALADVIDQALIDRPSIVVASARDLKERLQVAQHTNGLR